MLFGAGGFVQQVVAADCFGLGIAEECERVALFFTQIFGDFGGVYADGYGAHALRCELWKTLLNASQLEVAERSPVAAVEN